MRRIASLLFALAALARPGASAAQEPEPAAFDCAELSDAALEAAAARSGLPLPGPAQAHDAQPALAPPFLSTAQIHPFADAAGVLSSNFGEAAAYALMASAANEVIARYGDRFDFVGFWTNFDPHHTIGTAFYRSVENDVQGIRDPSPGAFPPALFNFRPLLGLAGDRVEGMVMMWNVNSSGWRPGNANGTTFTRIAINHEFAHRFTVHLPPLLDGRRLQGTGGPCGSASHWNRRVDGQGSAMELGEWVGAAPAVREPGIHRFNTDTGGVFSYVDLYLLGMVSPAEMDLGMSELRYMDSSDCSTTYYGSISRFSASDVVAAAGARVPSSGASQKVFRTAWVMIHRPGDAPDPAEIAKATAIIEQQSLDWTVGTLGRSSMDHTLEDGRAAVLRYGCDVNPPASMTVLSGLPRLGGRVVLGIDNPYGTQAAGSLPLLYVAAAPAPGFPCGARVPFGMRGPSEVLVSTAPGAFVTAVSGPPWSGPGAPAPIALDVPHVSALLGISGFAQGVLFDASATAGRRVGLTDAVEIRVGL